MTAENAGAEKKSPKVISVINYKGGVGKTTLTANIGACLARHYQKKVLLIDADSQTNLTAYFFPVENIAEHFGDKTIKIWFDAILAGSTPPSLVGFAAPPSNPKDARIHSDLYEHPQSKGNLLHIVPSDLRLIHLDIELAQKVPAPPPKQTEQGKDDSEAWYRAFGQFHGEMLDIKEKGEFDIVLIDCPPNFNIVTQNVILGSDGILVPTKLDNLSTMGIEYLRTAIEGEEEVREHHQGIVHKYNSETLKYPEAKPKFMGIVPTMTHDIGYGEEIREMETNVLAELRDFGERRGIPIMDKLVLRETTNHVKAAKDSCPLVVMKEAGIPFQAEDSAEKAVRDIKKFVAEFLKRAQNLGEEGV